MMQHARPIDQARVGRLVIAILDRDRQRAEAVVREAIQESALPELFDTTTGALMSVLRLAIGDDNVRQWATDWILHAQTEADS